MEQLEKNVKNKKFDKGITLIALSVSIIVLIILASISVVAIKDEDGIINQAKRGKEETEISEEKEIINISILQAIEEDRIGKLKSEILQNKLDSNVGKEKTEVIEDEYQLIVRFTEKDRYYEIDKDGNMDGPKTLIKDSNVGDLSKNNKNDGSEEKPFEINCIEDLVTFSIMTNGGNEELGLEENTFTDKCVVLNRTLDFKSIFSYNDFTTTKYGDLNTDGIVENIKKELTKTEEGCVGFTPMNIFGGYFDGKGNEIQNIYINREEAAALFAINSVWGSGFKSVKNIGITGKIISKNDNAAGIVTKIGAGSYAVKNIENCWNKAEIAGNKHGVAGIAYPGGESIVNCYNTGNVTNTYDKNEGLAGGITAGLGGTVLENCHNTGNITGTYYTGGIASGHGNHKTTVINCYNKGRINGKVSVGGIIGAGGEIIKNCYNTGEVKCDDEYAGGIIGAEAVEIYNCYNIGNVYGNRCGGICHRTTSKIINCYNVGEIKGTHCGGIAAMNDTEGITISNCFNVGEILYGGFGTGGGIIGSNTKSITINNCYTIGKVEPHYQYGTSYKGAILGNNEGTVIINRCYYLKTEESIQAIDGIEDSTLDVVQCLNVKEITADILNGNINLIEHEEEWLEWKQGKEYPMLNI